MNWKIAGGDTDSYLTACGYGLLLAANAAMSEIRSRTEALKPVLERPSPQVLAQPIPARPGRVSGLQRSVREWAMRQGWGGRPVRQEQAQGILVAPLGMLGAHLGYSEARQAS
jgi:hypothetical protein